MNQVSVLLTSYMRPELTKRSILRLLQYTDIESITVVIDGLRNGASEEEKRWRKETIDLVTTFEDNSKLELWIYDSNIGITEHYLRLQQKVISKKSVTVWLEEDIDLDLEMFVDLDLEKFYSQDPFLLSGYSHANHNFEDPRSVKANLFLPMWGLIMNESFSHLIRETWEKKTYKDDVVSDAIQNVLSGKRIVQRIHANSVLNYWQTYCQWSLMSANRWDALANYALWTKGFYSFSSINKLANDISYLDFRGMNQRSAPKKHPEHDFDEINVSGYRFCHACEVLGSRINPNPMRRIFSSLQYRWDKFNKSNL